MFNQFKAMGAVADLLKNREKLEQAGVRIKDKLEATRVIGEAGGGAVRVTMRCNMKVEDVEFGAAVTAGIGADEQSALMARRLVVDATNDALEKAQAIAKQTIEQEAQELGLPGLGDHLGKLLP